VRGEPGARSEEGGARSEEGRSGVDCVPCISISGRASSNGARSDEMERVRREGDGVGACESVKEWVVVAPGER
jgi:hypothetical protein